MPVVVKRGTHTLQAGHDGVLLALLSRADAASGCAVDGKDLQGSTALHWAASVRLVLACMEFEVANGGRTDRKGSMSV